MAGRDPLSLEILGGLPGEFQHLGRNVLENPGGEDGGRGADTRHVGAVLEQAVHATHGELEVGASGPADILRELHLLLVRRVVFGLVSADSDFGLVSEGRVVGR